MIKLRLWCWGYVLCTRNKKASVIVTEKGAEYSELPILLILLSLFLKYSTSMFNCSTIKVIFRIQNKDLSL